MSFSPGPGDRPPAELAAEIRGALQHIESLDRCSDGYLASLAFVLHRVAAADRDINEREVERMERILVEHASLSQPEAVLTVEMAKHRCRAADCGHSYDASRHLRALLGPGERERLHRFLESVAAADGQVRPSEQAAVRQIAAELGLLGRSGART
ncbi:MAG TPA: TerB family tellurite resistance protein [Chondromyces sp.]|nr:TerB family tellurite resistance protein [Chondromyces sp.]